MNLETLDLLTQKIEKALATIRSLRTENQRLQERSLGMESQARLLESQLGTAHAEHERCEAEIESKTTEAQNLMQELIRKDEELEAARLEVAQRSTELKDLQDSLREKDDKIQAAALRLEQVMTSLETELDVRIPTLDDDALDGRIKRADETALGAIPQDLFGFSQRS
jgi:chromosome segregation ATPase